jgi:NADH dehydrogenase [ubiquinone] 1 alpha subcomplex assembly factor 3
MELRTLFEPHRLSGEIIIIKHHCTSTSPVCPTMLSVTTLPKMAGTRSIACQCCFQQALSGRAATVRSAAVRSPFSPQHQCFSINAQQHIPPAPAKSKDRGPTSKEDTQTDFNAMNILSATPAPTTAVDACMVDGFALNSGLKVTGSGVLLVGGEAFRWRPWMQEGKQEGAIGTGNSGGKILNKRGQFDVDKGVWGVLDLVWPKPDLLILGTGRTIVPVSPETRSHLTEMGIRVEVQDTRNAAAQFNLLATERGVQQVVGALVPIGWRERK